MKKQFIENEEGQGLIEYLLIISLIAIVVIIALTLFGQNVRDYWNRSATKVTAPMGG